MMCVPYHKVYVKLNDGARCDLFCDVGVVAYNLKTFSGRLPSGVMNITDQQIHFKEV